MTVRADTNAAAPPIPRLAIGLLVGAALHLVVLVISRSVMNGSLDLAPGTAIIDLTSAMPLVLAASLVVGRDRWPTGRAWLTAAAAAFALAAVLNAATWIALAVSWPPDSVDANSLPSVLGSALRVAIGLAAPLLAAVGLWRSRPPGPAGPRAPWLWGAVAVTALVLGVQVLAILPYYDDLLPWVDPDNDEPFLAAMSAAGMLVPVSFAVLGIAAIRAVPGRYVVPEVLVAAGTLMVAGGGALSTAASVTVMRAMNPPWWATQLTLLIILSLLVGMALGALGFYSARISAPGER